jgi:VanZ family protein
LSQFYLSRLPRWLRDFVPLILWMALIFWFSSQSVLVDIESDANEKLIYKTAHITVYAVLAWLWWRALAARREVSWSILLLALLFTVLYGISDEIHQLFVPGRHGQIADIFFDTGGALVMILLIRRVKRVRDLPPIELPAPDIDKNQTLKVK